jgi:integrase/recombinase XerC
MKACYHVNMANVIPIFSDDGKNGINRGVGRNMLSVNTDAEAIAVFLKQHEHSAETHRSYHREIQRLIQWATFVRRKPLSSLLPQDFEAYRDFLRNPPKDWCNGLWGRGKLFNGPLSITSQRYAFSVIGSLLGFLAKHGYLHSIPLFKTSIVGRPSAEIQRRRTRERQLDSLQRKALLSWFDVNDTLDANRARFAVSLMFYLGLRVNEVATHGISNFVRIKDRWIFQVTGKGSKYEELGVPKQMVKELERYREKMGFTGPVESDENALISGVNSQPVTSRRVRQLVKDAIVAASSLLEDEEAKASMRACSPHWFRHMFAARQADMGVRIEDLKKNARHSKAETTFLYIDSDAERRHAAIDDMTLDLEDAL